MNCPKCKKELPEDVKFCSDCGHKVAKKSHKKDIIIVAAIFVSLVLIGAIFGEEEPTTQDAGSTVTTISAQETKTTTTTTTTTTKPTTTTTTQSPEEVKKAYIAECKQISFEELSRNPDKLKGNKYTLTGEVIQVQEPSFGDTVELRINVTKHTYEYIDDVTYTDTIYATVEIPDGADRILEGDIITLYGECDGLYTYTSVLGSKISLPKIDIAYFTIN